MRSLSRALGASLLLVLLAAAPAAALDALVQKPVVRLRDFPFESGETIPVLELGVETYGSLAPTADNVVLIGTYFAGDSHAAGRYTPDGRRGWWDALIGPGAAIDTDRWFVVCTDLIASQKVEEPDVVTTGPATEDPRTGRPYGPRFPAVTVRDQVRAQRAVLAALGVRHLRAVVGPSLGGLLAWQWAVDYPDFVDVVVPAAAPPTFSSAARQGFRTSALAVRSDPAWCMGYYYLYGVEPVHGMAMALRGLTALASGRPWTYSVDLPKHLAEARAFEPNHYLRFLDMHAEYGLDEDAGSLAAAFARIRARVLVVGFDDDDFVSPAELQEAGDALAAAGVRHRVVIAPGTQGHLSVLHDLAGFARPLEEALERP